MSNIIKKIKIKKQDGTFTDYIPIGAEAGNVNVDGESVENKLNKKPYYYNSVADMKADTKLKVGDMVITLGYYEANDGGAGEYRIVNDNTLIDNGGSVHELTNSLKAKLIIDNWANVKQFGAYGDNVHDDTNAFINATNISKNLVIPNGTYLTDYINFSENSKIEGENSIINVQISGTRICKINSNTTIRNLTINSINPDREWNRIDFVNSHNITLDNCQISGFRQETIPEGAAGKNVWGLYFKDCSDIQVINCKFDNNNFEDVIIEYNCENIVFKNVTSPTGLKIDIEPSENAVNGNKTETNNILFENCKIDFIHTTDYYYTGNTTKNITLLNCLINVFAYHGSDVTLINCNVTSYKAMNLDTIFAGPLKIMNSASFGDNLIKDPYFDSVSKNENSYWNINYTSVNWPNMIKSVRDTDGLFVVLNYDNLKKSAQITSLPINIDETKKYLLRILSKSIYPNEGTSSVSLHAKLLCYDENDNELSSIDISFNRAPAGTVTPLSEQNAILKLSEGTKYIKIRFRNGSEATQALYLQACGLYEIKQNVLGLSHNLPEFEKRQHRIFYNNEIPNANYLNFEPNDQINYNTPSTHIGAICTVAGSPGTWKAFGAIEA